MTKKQRELALGSLGPEPNPHEQKHMLQSSFRYIPHKVAKHSEKHDGKKKHNSLQLPPTPGSRLASRFVLRETQGFSRIYLFDTLRIRFVKRRATRLSKGLSPISCQVFHAIRKLLEGDVESLKFPGVWVQDA